MKSFTSGKWEAGQLYGDHYVVFSNGHAVVDCFRNEVNARLVAAAPEMYELLQTLMHQEYDNTTTAILLLEAAKLLKCIDGEEAEE